MVTHGLDFGALTAARISSSSLPWAYRPVLRKCFCCFDMRHFLFHVRSWVAQKQDARLSNLTSLAWSGASISDDSPVVSLFLVVLLWSLSLLMLFCLPLLGVR